MRLAKIIVMVVLLIVMEQLFEYAFTQKAEAHKTAVLNRHTAAMMKELQQRLAEKKRELMQAEKSLEECQHSKTTSK